MKLRIVSSCIAVHASHYVVSWRWKLVVHGLWPQIGKYGTSKCVRPGDTNEKLRVREKINQNHEWKKHGRCAGVDNAADYFEQVCSMAVHPLNVMKQALADDKDLQGNLAQYRCESFASTAIVCADETGKWHYAKVRDFQHVCGRPSTSYG